MRKTLFTLSLCLVVIATSFANAISFQEKDFKTIQAEAQRLDKVFFIYYYGERCPPCQMMKENTFSNSEIINMVNENFIAAKVDLNSEMGQDWKSHSTVSVMFMPTVIFFSPQGKFINKYEQWITADKFERLLQMNLEIGEIMSRNAPKPPPPPIVEKPVETNKIIVPSTVYEVDKSEKNKTPNAPTLASRPTPPALNPLVAKKKNLSPNPIHVDPNPMMVEKPKPIGQSIYAVQLGVFGNAESVDTYVNEMKVKTKLHDIYVMKDLRGEVPMYRVLAGEYDSIKDALLLVEQIGDTGIKAFVKKIQH